MNVLSVICIITLALYLLMVLAFNQRGNGRPVFRMVYSTVVLALLCGIFYVVFESTVTEFAAFIPAEQNIMRTSYALLMLLLPANVAIQFVSMALKKKAPVVLLIISAAVDVLGMAGALLYTGIADGGATNALTQMLIFVVLYLPYLLAFAFSGLMQKNEKPDKILIDCSLYLDLAVSVGFLIFIGFTVYETMLDFGLSGLFPFVPFVLGWLAVPIIPMLVERHFKNQDAIRNGEEPRSLIFFKKKSK